MPDRGFFDLGKPSPIIKEYTDIKDNFVLRENVLLKATGFKHSISVDELSNLAEKLQEPLMIFKSDTVDDAYVIFVEMTNKLNLPVVAAVHINKKRGRYSVTDAASVHSRMNEESYKDNTQSFINAQVKKGNFVYASKKSQSWFTTFGLQLPSVVQTFIDSNQSVSQTNTEVNTFDKNNSGNSSTKFSVGKTLFTEDDIKTIQNIGKKNINDFTSEEIKKTDVFAEKYSKELGTKSPFFRAWFVDWRANDNTHVKIASIPEYINSNESRKEKRGIVQNKDTKWDIRISREGETNTIAHSGSNHLSEQALSGIRELIKNAIFLDTEVHEHHSNNAMNDLIAFDQKLYALGKMPDGNIGLYKITVEEYYQSKTEPNNKKFHNLKYITKVAELSADALSGQTRSGGSAIDISTTEYTVSQLFELVKQNDKNFQPKEASKVVNEDGTPKVVYHGTGEDFTIFDITKSRSYDEKLDYDLPGFYFSENTEESGSYGENLGAYSNTNVNTDSYGNVNAENNFNNTANTAQNNIPKAADFNPNMATNLLKSQGENGAKAFDTAFQNERAKGNNISGYDFLRYFNKYYAAAF
ncbi:MAG: hypothetical protein SOZ34_07895 [Clostridia bacterium]|nr:hypothetical protein [Clostridia bacterium]